jgi:hypothetical protein
VSGTGRGFETAPLRKHKRCAQGRGTNRQTMTLTKNLGILATLTLMVACSIMPPRRQYVKETKRQTIPNGLLNSRWTLDTFENKKMDCSLSISFYDKGRFTFTIEGQLFKGDNLYYVVKDSTIQFHARPVDKLAWPTFNCEPKPDEFARNLSGDRKFKIVDDKLILWTNNRTDFIFKKT